jgi:hypothetical protein
VGEQLGLFPVQVAFSSFLASSWWMGWRKTFNLIVAEFEIKLYLDFVQSLERINWSQEVCLEDNISGCELSM